ncbi:hypothetical protein I6N95_14960, partial [Vagococcus sp. BWB3-3]
AETSLLTKKDWQLEDQSINRIEVLNSPQELVVAIKQSQEMTTTIELEGKVSEAVSRKLEKVAVSAGTLSIQLGANSPVGLAYVSEKSEKLHLTITLGKEVEVGEYFFDGTSNIQVKVPAIFEGRYKLNTNGEGFAKAPKTLESQKSLLEVDAAGNILISK